MLDPHEALHEELSDRYELQEVLGEGGMGTVYLALDLKHDRRVAIKTIRPDVTSDEIRQRFQREIGITAQLQHPHILPLLDSGAAGETLYYVMPYVEGESLQSRLDREGSVSVPEVVRIGRDVADGLVYAHRQGVIHRDIKPANILLSGEHALIVDFGIAKAFVDTGAETLTGTGLVVGSPAYMAPEQLRGSTTPQSDIYALGSVLYEAATGRRWRGGTEAEADWTEVPAALRTIVQRALSSSPKRRPDATAVLRALELTVGSSRRPWRSVALAALAVVALVAASWWAATNLGAGRSEVADGDGIESLAVLPFVNLMGDPDQDYFVAGMHEALISELAKIGALKVISRTSVSGYADTELSVPEIAGELGVAAVLEGGVQRAEERVRVNVQLVDARTDRHLWAQTYDEELTTANIFAIQSDIARKIAVALQATLAPDVEDRIDARPTESLEAYDLYNRGRYLFNRSLTREDQENAADLYRQAIAADPAYAPAYVGLASTYLVLWRRGLRPPEETLPLGRAAVERALELDETLAEAHAALGSVLTAERRPEDAERAFQRALELNPGSAEVHRQYGRLLSRVGRHEESVREARLAVELDPLSVGNRVSLVSRLFFARDFDGAIDESLNVLELEPDHVNALFWLGSSYILNGQPEEGIVTLQRGTALDPDNPFRVTQLAWAYARSKRREQALEALREIDVEQGPILKEIAIVYGELGELDRAFEYLDRAFAEGPGILASMPADPTADSLRSDPRFDELMRKAGLE